MLVAEAVAAGWEVEAQYVAPGRRRRSTAPARSASWPPGVAERIAATESPPGLFAVVRSRADSRACSPAPGFVVVADRVADPGNLGTILRSAEAAGVDAVVLTPGTVDVLNPKVVRASAGALFHVPVVAGRARRRAAPPAARSSARRRTAARRTPTSTGPAGSRSCSAARPTACADDAPVDEWVRIAHAGRAESLNVAMAATVLCFEAAAARR